MMNHEKAPSTGLPAAHLWPPSLMTTIANDHWTKLNQCSRPLGSGGCPPCGLQVKKKGIFSKFSLDHLLPGGPRFTSHKKINYKTSDIMFPKLQALGTLKLWRPILFSKHLIWIRINLQMETGDWGVGTKSSPNHYQVDNLWSTRLPSPLIIDSR